MGSDSTHCRIREEPAAVAELFECARAGASGICDESGEAEVDGEEFWLAEVGGGILADEIARAAASELGVLFGSGGLELGSLGEVDAQPGLRAKRGPERGAEQRERQKARPRSQEVNLANC